MALTLKVPGIGESIREATVGVWKKAEGDFVALDEPLVEIESEKATLEVPSPGAGILKKILRRQGETVAIGEALAEIDDAAKGATASAGKAKGRAAGGAGANGNGAEAKAVASPGVPAVVSSSGSRP